MHRNEEDVTTKLQRIAAKASNDKGCQFTSLFHLMNICCETPEDSDFTSIQTRIKNHLKQQKNKSKVKKDKDVDIGKILTPFIGNEHLSKQQTAGIQFSETDYFTLVDVTGRLIREDKRGYIPAELQPILRRLGINSENWLDSVQHFGRKYHVASGSVEKLQQMSAKLEQCWMQGLKTSQLLYA